MLHAVSYALLDSLNALLIGVIVALGVMLPRAGRYRRIVALLVAGDWLGVFLLALVTLLVFDGIRDVVQQALESPVFGIVLIVVGVLTLLLTLRGSGEGETALVRKLLGPLQEPSGKTFAVGLLLGFVQSATSVPFFAGLAYLSTSGLGPAVRYVGLFFYASLALSLPALSAVFVGMVRAHPFSPFGRAFEYMRTRRELMVKLAGYLVAVALTLFGVGALL